MKISVKETQLGLRNSTARLPFRYGKACLTKCPQAVLRVLVEADGKTQAGYSGDCLPPSWFDKSPDKDFPQQIDDMLGAIALAERVYQDAFNKPASFFPVWRQAHQQLLAEAARCDWTPLLASFGSSMAERAILDAMCRLEQVSFADAARANRFGIAADVIHPALAKATPADWLPREPQRAVFVRHTVGLADPITAAEIPDEDRIDDGFPQALEEYIQRSGLRYFKIKVSNRLDHDLNRLKAIVAVVEAHCGTGYGATLDGNEQYGSAADFDELIAAIRSDSQLATFWKNTIAIEQPLERTIALDAEHTQGIRELSQTKPVIIDESDGTLDSYEKAIAFGYRGVSSKNCKGTIKSLLNAGLTWHHNGRGEREDYLMTGEDLCTVGIVPVQADLCLVATLGLKHVERNGHHYQRGLSYLPAEQQAAALAAHPDFYAEQHGIIAPRLADGQFQIGSLQCAGFGFDVEPDMTSMQAPDDWEFASLGL